MNLRVSLKIVPRPMASHLGMLAVLLAAPVAQADRRAYGETYEAVTAPKGELDIESWTTFATEGEFPGGSSVRGVRQMVELEYGLTERWDVALYNMLDVGTDGQNGYAGLKLETRFRLSMPGEWAVDPVLYLEYQRLFRGDAKQKFELKAIVAKDLGPWNFAGNLAGELEQYTDGGFNPELEFAFGVSRELLGPTFKLGFEAFGKVEKGNELATSVWVGPALSWATRLHGVLQGLWVTVAAGHGLTDESQATYARAVVGLQF
jgi:hypothetical protein